MISVLRQGNPHQDPMTALLSGLNFRRFVKSHGYMVSNLSPRKGLTVPPASLSGARGTLGLDKESVLGLALADSDDVVAVLGSRKSLLDAKAVALEIFADSIYDLVLKEHHTIGFR